MLKDITRLTQPSFTTLEIQSMKITHTIQYWLLKASQTLWYICLISTRTPTQKKRERHKTIIDDIKNEKGRRVSQQEMGQSWMVPDDLPRNYETGDFTEAVDSATLQRDAMNSILGLT